MKNESCFSDIEVKRANILHHNIEAEFFERMHPEGSSVYEQAKVLKSIALIAEGSNAQDLCVDIGCGTGFAASFELSLHKIVVALDISRKMLEVTRNKFGHSINLVLCDAEFLPLKTEIADLVSASSVLHHLPKPFNSMIDTFRVIKPHGYFLIIREPNLQRMRRFFDFFDNVVVGRLVKLVQKLSGLRSEFPAPISHIEGLDYSKVDIHYHTGFCVAQLAEFAKSKKLEVILAHSYHWVFPNSDVNWLKQLLTRCNFVVARVPLSDRFGRYVIVIAKKPMQTM